MGLGEMKQSPIMDNGTLTGCCLVMKDQNAIDSNAVVDFKQCAILKNSIHFKCLLWILSNEQ